MATLRTLLIYTENFTTSLTNTFLTVQRHLPEAGGPGRGGRLLQAREGADVPGVRAAQDRARHVRQQQAVRRRPPADSGQREGVQQSGGQLG